MTSVCDVQHIIMIKPCKTYMFGLSILEEEYVEFLLTQPTLWWSTGSNKGLRWTNKWNKNQRRVLKTCTDVKVRIRDQNVKLCANDGILML